MPIEPVSVPGCATIDLRSAWRCSSRRTPRDRHIDVTSGRSGFVVAGDHQLAPDDVGGYRRPARAVDAQHDRLDRVVVADPADLLDDRVRSDDRPVHAIEAAPARDDRADGVEDGDARSRPDADRSRPDALIVPPSIRRDRAVIARARGRGRRAGPRRPVRRRARASAPRSAMNGPWSSSVRTSASLFLRAFGDPAHRAARTCRG